MEETLEHRLANRLHVSTCHRVGKYLLNIVMHNDLEDFELLRLDEEGITIKDIKTEIISFYEERNTPVSLFTEGKIELIRNKGEMPILGINVTYYGANAKVTVMNIVQRKFPEPGNHELYFAE
ncbi:MAG: hypothetical protein AABX07_05140 [Nanoarchaeota archaeon]